MKNKDIIFPMVFITGEFDKSFDEKQLCSIALQGWANCMSGGDVPINFGKGISEIGKKLGINPTVENILRYAKCKGWL